MSHAIGAWDPVPCPNRLNSSACIAGNITCEWVNSQCLAKDMKLCKNQMSEQACTKNASCEWVSSACKDAPVIPSPHPPKPTDNKNGRIVLWVVLGTALIMTIFSLFYCFCTNKNSKQVDTSRLYS